MGVCTHKLSSGNREAAATQVQQDKKKLSTPPVTQQAKAVLQPKHKPTESGLKGSFYLLAGDGVLYPLRGSPDRAGGDKLPNMWGKK